MAPAVAAAAKLRIDMIPRFRGDGDKEGVGTWRGYPFGEDDSCC